MKMTEKKVSTLVSHSSLSADFFVCFVEWSLVHIHWAPLKSLKMRLFFSFVCLSLACIYRFLLPFFADHHTSSIGRLMVSSSGFLFIFILFSFLPSLLLLWNENRANIFASSVNFFVSFSPFIRRSFSQWTCVSVSSVSGISYFLLLVDVCLHECPRRRNVCTNPHQQHIKLPTRHDLNLHFREPQWEWMRGIAKMKYKHTFAFG